MTKEQIKQKVEEYLKHFINVLSVIGDKTFILKDIENAYIAGAIENGIHWHDLRKDPNDLPESSPFHEVLNENGMKMYYDDVLKKWNMFTQHGIVQARPPIAWCEIPQFTE